MIDETCQTLELHFSRARQAHTEIMGFFNQLNIESLDNYEKIKVIDSFIFRFTKIQDLMGQKFFREILDSIGEFKPTMSFLDVLDRLEKLELIESAEAWVQLRNLRDVLTHEYPDNRQELLEGIKLSVQSFTEVSIAYQRLNDYLAEKGLL